MRFGEMTREASSCSRQVGAGRDLLGYLYAKATIGEDIEGDVLTRLRAANNSVEHTRAKLMPAEAFGAITPLSVTNLNRRLYYLRAKLAINPCVPEPRFCTLLGLKAEFMRVGGCNEMAGHAIGHYFWHNLKSNECVAQVSASLHDHVWGEIHAGNTPVVVMDAWSRGPAVLREDSRHADDRPQFNEAYDASMYGDMCDLMRTTAATLKGNERRHIQRFKKFWSVNGNKPLASFATRYRHSVFSDTFWKKTSGGDSAGNLSRDLRAIRILRNLGLTVQVAVRHKDIVFRAFEHHLRDHDLR